MKLKIFLTLFVLVKGLCGMNISDKIKSSHVHSIIITDMEPDDSAAIITCVSQGTLPDCICIVDRSEEDNWDRLKSFKQLSSLLGIQNTPFKYAKAEQIAHFISEYVSKYDKNENDEFMIICLANFMPLYDLSRKLDIPKSKITVAAYGSVNMRWALKALDIECKNDKKAYDAKKSDFLQMINTGYKAFYLFETFGAFGQKNAVDNNIAPELIELLQTSSHPLIKFLNAEIGAWNDIIMKSEIKDLNISDEYKLLTLENLDSYTEQLKKSAEDESFSDRLSAKIVYSILQCKSQFVFADIGLMIALLNPKFNYLFENKHIDIPDRFLVTSDKGDLDTGFYFINKCENKTELLKEFSKYMSDVFTKFN